MFCDSFKKYIGSADYFNLFLKRLLNVVFPEEDNPVKKIILGLKL